MFGPTDFQSVAGIQLPGLIGATCFGRLAAPKLPQTIDRKSIVQNALGDLHTGA